jgi:hypothetical protein
MTSRTRHYQTPRRELGSPGRLAGELAKDTARDRKRPVTLALDPDDRDRCAACSSTWRPVPFRVEAGRRRWVVVLCGNCWKALSHPTTTHDLLGALEARARAGALKAVTVRPPKFTTKCKQCP